MAPVNPGDLEKCLDGRANDFMSTKPKLQLESDCEADEGEQESGKPKLTKVTLKTDAVLSEVKSDLASFSNMRNFGAIFRHVDTKQLAIDSILPTWTNLFEYQPRMWAFFSAARRRNRSTWKDDAEDNPPKYDCIFFNHQNRCTMAGHEAFHHCMCCGAHHPIRYQTLTEAAAAVPNSIQCPKLREIVNEFKLLAKRLGVRRGDRIGLESCLAGESEEFQAYRVQPPSPQAGPPSPQNSSLSSTPSTGKKSWVDVGRATPPPSVAVVGKSSGSTPPPAQLTLPISHRKPIEPMDLPLLSDQRSPGDSGWDSFGTPQHHPATEVSETLPSPHRFSADPADGKRIGKMDFATLNGFMKKEEDKFRYLLCFSELFRNQALMDVTKDKILPGWLKFQCRSKPSMWAFLSVARRRQLTAWKDESREATKWDCLNYNCGYCRNPTAEHEITHTCMCCGGKHMLRYESLSEAAADASNIRCPIVKAIVKQLEILELKVRPVSRDGLEACLQGAASDFEVWQPVQVARKAPTKPAPSTGSPGAALATSPTTANESATPNASQDSFQMEAIQPYLPGPLQSAIGTTVGVTIAPDTAIETFKTHFQSAREKEVRHEFIWYPEKLELGRPFTIWCKGACCSLSTDEHRHELSEGYFWDKANPYSVGGARAVVVKQYRIKGKGSDSSAAGYQREIETFEQVYPTELLEWKAPYRFQGGEAFSFLVLRKHDDDLSKILVDNPPLEERLLLIQKVLLIFREAHLYGLIHGDVKPGNIVRESTLDGRDTATNVGQSQSYNLKLIDFEFASFESPETGAPPSMPVGGLTRLWGSPDQHNGSQALQTDDCWSLALVLYEIYHYRPRKPEEQHYGAPLFYLDAHGELLSSPQAQKSQFTRWVQKIIVNISDERDIATIPFPKKCNALLRSLMEQLFRYALSRDPDESVSRAQHPLTYTEGAPHMLFVDSEKLCILLLHLQHRFVNRTPPYDRLLLSCRAMTEPKPWLENLSPKLISVIQQYEPNFRGSLTFDAAEALRYLRNLLAHPDDPTSVLMCHFIDNAGELLAELQAQLSAARITFDLRRTCLRVPTAAPTPADHNPDPAGQN